ncbi:unnamed protein product [Cuscuta europaea]|uniref:Uncharacterized protein n=1 Tax=Cuscuta europaea TaxID=41803 RepID=A0A9P0ZDL7_CUSEU|nr:unnamed protein product [Cuscuta europaea]
MEKEAVTTATTEEEDDMKEKKDRRSLFASSAFLTTSTPVKPWRSPFLERQRRKILMWDKELREPLQNVSSEKEVVTAAATEEEDLKEKKDRRSLFAGSAFLTTSPHIKPWRSPFLERQRKKISMRDKELREPLKNVSPEKEVVMAAANEEDLKEKKDRPSLFAGSAFLTASPPPSSLPLPGSTFLTASPPPSSLPLPGSAFLTASPPPSSLPLPGSAFLTASPPPSSLPLPPRAFFTRRSSNILPDICASDDGGSVLSSPMASYAMQTTTKNILTMHSILIVIILPEKNIIVLIRVMLRIKM